MTKWHRFEWKVSKITGKEFMLDLSFLSFLFGLGSGFFEWPCRGCDMIEMWWNVMKCGSFNIFNCNNWRDWRDEDWFWFCFRLFSFPQGLLLHLMGHLEQGSAKSVSKCTASKSWQKFWRFKKFSFGMKIFNLCQFHFPKKCTFIYLNLPVLCVFHVFHVFHVFCMCLLHQYLPQILVEMFDPRRCETNGCVDAQRWKRPWQQQWSWKHMKTIMII